MAKQATFQRDANGKIFTVPFDPAWDLADEEQIAALLDVSEDESATLIAKLHETVARARQINAGEVVIPMSIEDARGWIENFESILATCSSSRDRQLYARRIEYLQKCIIELPRRFRVEETTPSQDSPAE